MRFQGLAAGQDSCFFRYCKELIILFIITTAVIFIPVKTPQFSSLPFNYSSIISLEGKLASDSRKIKGGLTLYSMKVEKVISKEGISADAEGLIKITVKGSNILKGSIVSAGFKKFPDINQFQNNSGRAVLMLRANSITNNGESYLIRSRRSVLDYVLGRIALIETNNGFVSALLTGNRDQLDERTALDIKKSGCSHILALSGMHLGIITALIFFILKPLLGIKKSLIAANIFSLFFLFMAGTSASLLRSFIFFMLISISKLFSRKTDLRKLIVLCFIITAFISPDDSSELSFQYSFIAAAGIIFTAELIYKKICFIVPPFAAVPLSCSLSAQLPAFVLSGLVFHEVYPSGIAASLILTPLIALFMWTAIPALFFVIITGRTFTIINAVLELQSDIIGKTASCFAGIPLLKVNSSLLALLFLLNIFIIVSSLFPGRNMIFLKRYR